MSSLLLRIVIFFCAVLPTTVSLCYASEAERGTVIYQQEGLEIYVYASNKESARTLAHFCKSEGSQKKTKYRVNVSFSAEHERRTQLFSPSYAGFVKEKVVPSLIKLCGDIHITEIEMSLSKQREASDPKWFELMNFTITGNGESVTQTSYNLNHVAEAHLSMEEIAALMPVESVNASSFPLGREKVLYEDDKITVYARGTPWCRPLKAHRTPPSEDAGLDIVVPVSYSELHQWLEAHYEYFEHKIIKPLVESSCFPGSSVNAKFYQKGKSAYLENVRYGFKKPKPQAGYAYSSSPRPLVFTVVDRHPGQTREARLASISANKAERDVWRTPCKGTFCWLFGGQYIQAIHANDVHAIKRMDRKIDNAITLWVQRKLGESIASSKRQDYSLLPVVADTYLYQYQQYALYGCPDNLSKKTYFYQYPTFEVPDYGELSMPDMGGEITSSTYIVPTELLPLCDKVCDAFGGNYDRLIINSLNSRPALGTINGVHELLDEYRCDRPDVKQFEDNLARLTFSYVDNKYAWLTSIEEPSTESLDKPKSVAHIKPIANPPVANTGATTKTIDSAESANTPKPRSSEPQRRVVATPSSSSAPPQTTVHQNKTPPISSTAENSNAVHYEQMNSEIASLAEKYTARLNTLSQNFQEKVLATSDPRIRSKLLAELQQEMARLNSEARKETEKVKAKYKNN
jgi:hypothetical protein